MALESDLTVALSDVRERIARAAERVGRAPGEITLVAVSKMQTTDAIVALAALGQRAFGENYAQELRDKKRALVDRSDLEWHFLGGLQKNKVKYVVGTASLIHSVDALELAIDIEQRAAHLGCTQDVLVEVNTGREAQKGGVLPEALQALLAQLKTLPHIRVRGLMTMGPLQEDAEQSRAPFRQLKALAQANEATVGPLGLSMGMSQDFEVAIEEGATWVRIGTKLFGARAARRRSTSQDI